MLKLLGQTLVKACVLLAILLQSSRQLKKFAKEVDTDSLNVRFGDFKIFDKIGEGGFDEVYKGEYLGTAVAGKKVKIKHMKLVKQSVLQKIVTNSHLRHPNIVLLMTYLVNADSLYL